MALSADGGRLFVASAMTMQSRWWIPARAKTSGKISMTLGKTGFGSLPTPARFRKMAQLSIQAAAAEFRGHYQNRQESSRWLHPGWLVPNFNPSKKRNTYSRQHKGISARGRINSAADSAYTAAWETLQFINLKTLPDLKTLTRQVAENNRLDVAEIAGSHRPVPVPARPGGPFRLQARCLHHPREPYLRFSILATCRKATRQNPQCIRRGGNSKRTRPGPAIRAPDNTYTSGTNSADGHQWVASALAKRIYGANYDAHERSYPYDGAMHWPIRPKDFCGTPRGSAG